MKKVCSLRLSPSLSWMKNEREKKEKLKRKLLSRIIIVCRKLKRSRYWLRRYITLKISVSRDITICVWISQSTWRYEMCFAAFYTSPLPPFFYRKLWILSEKTSEVVQNYGTKFMNDVKFNWRLYSEFLFVFNWIQVSQTVSKKKMGKENGKF